MKEMPPGSESRWKTTMERQVRKGGEPTEKMVGERWGRAVRGRENQESEEGVARRHHRGSLAKLFHPCPRHQCSREGPFHPYT